MALATTISFLLTVLLATAFVSKADDYNRKDYYEQPSSVPRHFRRLSQELHPGFYKRELDPIYDHGQLPQETRRQTIQGSDMNKRFGITPDTSISQFLRIVANNILLLLDITSREIIKGANKVIANLNNHEDGGINVPAETTMGSAAGMMASQFFGQYFRERWTGIMSHVVQESVDRFVTGSIDFFNRSTSGNQNRFSR